MKKFIICFSLVCTGFFSSCVDKNELVDEDSMPSFLGSSIYQELKNPDPGKGMHGSFNYYLRLVDDLGYAETLNRTGSKTVFPANDEAFQRFFESETWKGVTKYEDLSDSQKKLLLYGSMLDNALLINMLSNVSASDGVDPGKAVKHNTSLSVIDTLTTYPFLSWKDAYPNNAYWEKFNNGVSLVSDATKPMLVHFTREFMLNKNITTVGEGSDFSILMGQEYKDGDAYIFRNKVTAPDITCLNGYIHQVENVVVPPGNMAQVINNTEDLSIFDRMLDRFAMPIYNNKVTNDYHDWYTQQSKVQDMSGVVNPDSIFEVRYLSKVSQGGLGFNTDGNGAKVDDSWPLFIDPGWNEYYIADKTGSSESFLTDLGVIFAPTDQAFVEYFCNGEGKAIIERYKDAATPNDAAHLVENIDRLPMNIVSALISNMMKTSLTASVPSKFSTIVDDASDLMGVSLADLQPAQEGNGYDIKIANNGVIYVTKNVLGPKKYVAVSAPALFNDNTNVINWMITNTSLLPGTTNPNPYSIDLDFYAYLLAMTANYALLLPTDQAFDRYFVDPASLGHDQPTAIHYYPISIDPYIAASRWSYDPVTNQIGDSIGELNLKSSADMAIVKAQLQDIMQYHTVSMKPGQVFGANRYYQTKHGGAIRVEGFNGTNSANGVVKSGQQIDNGLAATQVEEVYDQKNGVSYTVDHLVQGPRTSVYSVLKNNPQFSDFLALCEGFDNETLLNWAGISSDKDPETGSRPIDRYKVFYTPGEGTDMAFRCLDRNVKMFSAYNYTLYAPDNDAMAEAYAKGLPEWGEYPDEFDPGSATGIMGLFAKGTAGMIDEDDAKAEARRLIDLIRSFVRYHFHNTSVYADNIVDNIDYTTFLVDDNFVNVKMSVSGGSGKLNVKDASGDVKVIDANGTKLVNKMTRDFEFDLPVERATRVLNSSFAVVHEISTPMYYNSSRRFDGE